MGTPHRAGPAVRCWANSEAMAHTLRLATSLAACLGLLALVAMFHTGDETGVVHEELKDPAAEMPPTLPNKLNSKVVAHLRQMTDPSGDSLISQAMAVANNINRKSTTPLGIQAGYEPVGLADGLTHGVYDAEEKDEEAKIQRQEFKPEPDEADLKSLLQASLRGPAFEAEEANDKKSLGIDPQKVGDMNELLSKVDADVAKARQAWPGGVVAEAKVIKEKPNPLKAHKLATETLLKQTEDPDFLSLVTPDKKKKKKTGDSWVMSSSKRDVKRAMQATRKALKPPVKRVAKKKEKKEKQKNEEKRMFAYMEQKDKEKKEEKIQKQDEKKMFSYIEASHTGISHKRKPDRIDESVKAHEFGEHSVKTHKIKKHHRGKTLPYGDGPVKQPRKHVVKKKTKKDDIVVPVTHVEKKKEHVKKPLPMHAAVVKKHAKTVVKKLKKRKTTKKLQHEEEAEIAAQTKKLKLQSVKKPAKKAKKKLKKVKKHAKKGVQHAKKP